ncbi:conserved hypothetical protein [Burkholderia sp. H160]|nr:conserved hypothetical protein [Burkholderia sp. H160]
MSLSDRYPAMEHMFSVYFGQDFDLFGETVPQIVSCYKRDDSHRQQGLIRELDSFRKEPPDDLDTAFKHFRRGFRPEGWGYTTASFLDEIQRLLSE